jgi:ABC-type antimicrobial peptide transport system permease subunit
MKPKTYCFNGKQFLNTLSRYSFLAAVNAIVLFFALPLALLMRLRSQVAFSDSSAKATMIETVRSQLGMDNVVIYAILAMVLAFVA